jgi:hypothetical protein
VAPTWIRGADLIELLIVEEVLHRDSFLEFTGKVHSFAVRRKITVDEGEK